MNISYWSCSFIYNRNVYFFNFKVWPVGDFDMIDQVDRDIYKQKEN